jgi:hypothetical protein
VHAREALTNDSPYNLAMLKSLPRTLANVVAASRTMLWIGLAFVALTMIAVAHSVAFGLPSLINWQTDDAIATTATFGTVAAIFIGLFQFRHQDEIQRSQFALDVAKEGVARAYQVLGSDQPTRRIAWVNAARILLRSTEAARNIKEPDHAASWELHKEEWRIKFVPFLRCSPQYYFGLGTFDQYGESIKLDDGEIKRLLEGTNVVTEFEVANYSSTSLSDKMLQERVIRVIFEFAAFPDSWIDPLKETDRFADAEIQRLDNQDLNGLLGYVKVRRGFRLVDGKVTKNAA